MKDTEKFYRKKYPKVEKLSGMDVEIISLLDEFKKNQNNIIKENKIYKSQIQSMIKEENYLIKNANEIISLSDDKKNYRDILKYKRDIGISKRIIKSLEDIKFRIAYLRVNCL